jgi:hypothetical protein
VGFDQQELSRVQGGYGMSSMADEQWNSKQPLSALIGILLLISVVLNVLLARKVSGLASSLEHASLGQSLQVGTVVPPIEGRLLDGAQQTLNYSDASIPTLLYVFTPQCVWCKKNLGNLKALIDNSQSRYRVVGISLTRQDLREYVDRERLGLPVYTDIGDLTRASYRLAGTPTTIVVSPGAKVLKVWSGVYTDHIRREIEAYFDIQLPGCCDESGKLGDGKIGPR